MKKAWMIMVAGLLSLSIGAQTTADNQKKSVQKVQVKQGEPAVLKAKTGTKVLSKKTTKATKANVATTQKLNSSNAKIVKPIKKTQKLQGNKNVASKKQVSAKADSTKFKKSLKTTLATQKKVEKAKQ